MTNRIDATFAHLKASGKKAFIAYICAGDPSLDATLEIVRTLEKCGVDIIELGLPFSDPLADGITIQMAAQRSLEAGTTTRSVLELVKRIRLESRIPIVLFTYLNPVYNYGFEAFHLDAAAAGADGVLLLDLPPDEQPCNPELATQKSLRRIRLIAPTTPHERMKEIASQAEGFVYYISREGVTGAQTTLAGNLEEQAAFLKSVSAAPVAVGFGISNADQARAVARCADGVVVGSAIVTVIARHGKSANLAQEVAAFIQPLLDATKAP